MKEKIRRVLRIITSYRVLLALWLFIGILNLISGDISRMDYLCVWAVVILELVLHSLDE